MSFRTFLGLTNHFSLQMLFILLVASGREGDEYAGVGLSRVIAAGMSLASANFFWSASVAENGSMQLP